MEEMFKYEDRNELYQFLINDFGFTVKNAMDNHEMGYYVNLTSPYFLLRYTYDRLYFSIDIISIFDAENYSYALSFLKDLIYNPESINAIQGEGYATNIARLNGLNDFLQKDFEKICKLMNKENYPDTKKKLEEGLTKQSYIKYPSTKPENK